MQQHTGSSSSCAVSERRTDFSLEPGTRCRLNMSESSENLTADAAVTGAVTSPSSIQENVPRGNGNAGGEAEAVQNETANNNLSGQDSTTT